MSKFTFCIFLIFITFSNFVKGEESRDDGNDRSIPDVQFVALYTSLFHSPSPKFIAFKMTFRIRKWNEYEMTSARHRVLIW